MKFTSIKGLSEKRRLVRAGKIRGGKRVKKEKADSRCKHSKEEYCTYCSYPIETPYFVVPEEVAEIYGDKPTELDVMFPVNDPSVIFPQSYQSYGLGKGLKCSGNGEEGSRLNDKTNTWEPCKCPCELLESKKCAHRGHLSFILPQVSVGAIYQMDTTSYHSIVDINSSIDYIYELVHRINKVPLKLKRIPRITNHDGQRQTHYTMRLELVGDVNFLNKLKAENQKVIMEPQYSLPAPLTENPVYDGPTFEESEVPEAQALQPLEAPVEVIAPAQPEEELDKGVILKRINKVQSIEDMATLKKWASEHGPAIKQKFKKDDRNDINLAFKKKEEAIEKKAQEQAFIDFSAAINSAESIQEMDMALEKAESILKDGAKFVQLVMMRDRKAQTMKGEK